jgi:hypothetical protein
MRPLQGLRKKRKVPDHKKPDDKRPIYWATAGYKLWVREKFYATGWSLDKFAEKLKEIDPEAQATDGGLAQFLGKRGSEAVGSNTTLMPTINKLFGEPPPMHYDPNDRIQRVAALVAAKLPELTVSERRIFSALFGVAPVVDGEALFLADGTNQIENPTLDRNRSPRK